MGSCTHETSFLQEVGIGFISIPSWWNLESTVLIVGLASQVLTGCDLQGQAPVRQQ